MRLEEERRSPRRLPSRARAVPLLACWLTAVAVGGTGSASSNGGGSSADRGQSADAPLADAPLAEAQVTLTGPGGSTLVVPSPGASLCGAVAALCGGGREGALCAKEALERVLADGAVVKAARQSMELGADALFLCSPPPFDLAKATTARVAALNELLQRAVDASRGSDSSSNGSSSGACGGASDATSAATLLDRYRSEARWSSLAAKGWLPVEKAAHFVHALSILPDNRHSIDRLAAALAEAADDAADAVDAVDAADRANAPAAAFSRARALLLHFAVLRGALQHPLQRPLHLVRGLAGRPVWRGDDVGVRFQWLAALTDARAVAAMQHELPAPGGWAAAGLALSAQPEGVHLGGAWGELHLLEAGRPHSRNKGRFPALMDALARSGGEFVNARLSVVLPGTHITPHCGVSNAKLRVHLGLRVPAGPRAPSEGDGGSGGGGGSGGSGGGGATASPPPTDWSGMIVAGERVTWSEGTAVVFDDSFEHEVRWRPAARGTCDADGGCGGGGDDDAMVGTATDTDERVVLILDVWHPDLPEIERVRARRQFAPDVPGGFRVGNRVRCASLGAGGAHAPVSPLFGAAGVVAGRAPDDPTRVAVDLADGGGERVSLWPSDVVAEDTWTALLPGGFERGDAVVVTAVAVGGIGGPAVGTACTVVGPGVLGAASLSVVCSGGGGGRASSEGPSNTGAAAMRGRWEVDASAVSRPGLGPVGVPAVTGRREGVGVNVLLDDPVVMLATNVVSAAEAAELVALGEPALRPSRLQGASNTDGLRTSWSGFLHGGDAWHPAVLAVIRRCAALGGMPWTHAEGVQIVRYRSGEHFADHRDWFTPNATGSFDARAGQRVLTALVYLSDGFEGGETVFPLLNVSVAPATGSALLWRNVDAARGGAPDRRVLHRGARVGAGGVKWAANVWFTERPFETYRTAVEPPSR